MVDVYLRSVAQWQGEGRVQFYSSPGVLRPGAGIALSTAEAKRQATSMKLTIGLGVG